MKVVIALAVLATVCYASVDTTVPDQQVVDQVPDQQQGTVVQEQSGNWDYANAHVVGVQRAQVQEPVAVVQKVVKKPCKKKKFIKIVSYKKVAPTIPVKKEIIPVPVPVPVKVIKQTEDCGIKVSSCFAKDFKVEATSFSEPITAFTGSYRAMCAPEIANKKAAMESKLKKEMSQKELCAKSEKNTKFSETKMKLMLKKEKYTKAVGEGKEKFLEKKVKSAAENAAKVVGQTMEFAKDANEKQNKKEDELYTKECDSKENAFKTVREGKQKVRIVYVKSVAKPTPVPAPVVVPVIKHQTQIINKVVPVPAPAQVQKTVVYVPAPSTVEEHVVVEPQHSLKEVLIKNGEKTTKMQLKSEEILGKSEITGKEQVHKESSQKVKATPSIVVVHKSNEGACKEKESKEGLSKSEIEQKLAVEKVKKEAAVKESKAKSAVPVVERKCNPVTALEKYVKKCKAHEELFAKAKITNEKDIKEIKIKSAQNNAAVTCEMTRGICKKIFAVSQLSDEAVQATVEDHTAKFEAAMAAAEKKNDVDEGKMKYNICESAASDVKYFVRHYLPKFTLLE